MHRLRQPGRVDDRPVARVVDGPQVLVGAREPRALHRRRNLGPQRRIHGLGVQRFARRDQPLTLPDAPHPPGSSIAQPSQKRRQSPNAFSSASEVTHP